MISEVLVRPVLQVKSVEVTSVTGYWRQSSGQLLIDIYQTHVVVGWLTDGELVTGADTVDPEFLEDGVSGNRAAQGQSSQNWSERLHLVERMNDCINECGKFERTKGTY
jgi:hypothetical protein